MRDKPRPLVHLMWPRLSDSPEHAKKMRSYLVDRYVAEKDTFIKNMIGMVMDRLDQEWNPPLDPDEITRRLEEERRRPE